MNFETYKETILGEATKKDFKGDKYAVIFFDPKKTNIAIILDTAVKFDNLANSIFTNKIYFDKYPVDSNKKRLGSGPDSRLLEKSPNKIINYYGYKKGKSKILSIVRIDKWKNLDWNYVTKQPVKKGVDLYTSINFGKIDKVISKNDWDNDDIFDKKYNE